MARRPIVLYPDPVLLAPTEKVQQIDDEIHELVRDMIETMYIASGIGLAANQIGVPLRLFVADFAEPDRMQEPIVFINPVITETEGRQEGDEGCLSFPDVNLVVERANKVTVEALDLDGQPFTFTGEGLTARAILHECEHLDGQVFVRNVSALRRELVRKQIKKRIKANDWHAAGSE